MFKKILIAVLGITVVGAAGAALAYQTASRSPDAAPTLSPVVGSPRNGSQAQAGMAQEAEGEPWETTGTIAHVDDFGIDLETAEGESVYIELGPPAYWQSQGVELSPGQVVSVSGSINEGMVHAFRVQLENGETLRLRSENGQPLWSGGAQQGGNGAWEGTHQPEPQVQPDEWITLEGTLMSYQGNMMTIGTDDGQLIAFQTGRPGFFSSQGVAFQVGDEIVVTGFYQGDRFVAGDILRVATGERVMLRDPNGRPLWAGPGNGNGNGHGHGHGQGQGGTFQP